MSRFTNCPIESDVIEKVDVDVDVDDEESAPTDVILLLMVSAYTFD